MLDPVEGHLPCVSTRFAIKHEVLVTNFQENQRILNPRTKVIGNVISCEPLGYLGRGFLDLPGEGLKSRIVHT